MVRIASTTGALGLEVAGCIAAGFLGGQWLDRKLGWGPWLGYIGLVAGIGAAIKALVRVTRAYQKSLKDDDGHDSPPDKQA
jgi:F0F1-type ATP synthase assembly protein I